MEDRDYYSVRINISKSVPIAAVISFFEKYDNVLICFEHKDKDIKNDHCHVLIWGCILNHEDFKSALESAIKGAKGNNRWAWCEYSTKNPFWSGVKYLCKGTQDSQPVIVLSKGITDIEHLVAYNEFWIHNMISSRKKAEDTSMRMVPRLLEMWQDSEEHIRIQQNKKSSKAYELFRFWRQMALDEWHKEKKGIDDDNLMKVVNGLCLQSDKQLYDVRTLYKHEKLAGFGNASADRYRESWEVGHGGEHVLFDEVAKDLN